MNKECFTIILHRNALKARAKVGSLTFDVRDIATELDQEGPLEGPPVLQKTAAK
jgi:hypothetical protein